MGKILFLPQPHASKICSGILKVVHSESPLEKFSDVVIYGDEQVDNPDRSVEQRQLLHNQQLFGLLPTKIPEHAAVGMATIGEEIPPEILKNPLGYGYVYEVRQAYTFDEAMKLSKSLAELLAKTNFFEQLPRHSVRGADICGEFGVLSFYVNKEVFFSLGEGCEITLELTPKVVEATLDENGELKEFSSFYVHYANLAKRFSWNSQCCVETERDEEGNIIYYPSDIQPSGTAARVALKLICSSDK